MTDAAVGRQDRLFYEFDLEAMVPEDHFLRRIDAVLELSRLRGELKPHYSHLGCPSICPELMIRMLLVGYCYSIRSNRRVCDEVKSNLVYRWFCGLGLEDKVPHHSTFSKNRLGRRPARLGRPDGAAGGRRGTRRGAHRGRSRLADSRLRQYPARLHQPGSQCAGYGRDVPGGCRPPVVANTRELPGGNLRLSTLSGTARGLSVLYRTHSDRVWLCEYRHQGYSEMPSYPFIC